MKSYEFLYRQSCIKFFKDALSVDPLVTVQRFDETVYSVRETILDDEISWIQDNRIDLVLVDATPIACVAAKRCGIESVLLSNFTWDFIYTEMFDMIKERLSPEVLAHYSTIINCCVEVNTINIS